MRKSARQRLINSLKRSSWREVEISSLSGIETLTDGFVVVTFLEERWELYYRVGGELTFGTSHPYDRRQSQNLKREVDKFGKWRRHEVSF